MKEYINNFNWLFVEKIIRVLGGVFVGIWVARYLGPVDYGVISYGLAFIAFFSWVSHLGLIQIVVRELTKYPDKSNQILGSAFLLKIIGAVISICLIAISVVAIKPDDDLMILVIVLLSITYFFQAFEVIDYYYQAKVLSKYSAFSRSVAFISSSAVKIYLIYAGYSVAYFVMASVLEALLVAALLVYLFLENGHAIRAWRFNLSLAKNLLKDSWPLMVSVFLISIHLKIDQVMIDSMISIKAVGIYSVAVTLSQAWVFVPAIAVSTLLPYFISLKERDEIAFRRRLMQLLSCMFWIGVLVGVGALCIGKEAIIFLFGNEYSGAHDALTYNIWGGIFVAQGMASSIWMIAENQQVFRLYVQIMAVCVNIVLNIVLIPILGIQGAAISTFLTHFLATWVFGMFFRELRMITFMMIKAALPHYMIIRLNGR